jgi:hypothetical protein
LGDAMVDTRFWFMTAQFLMIYALAINFEDAVVGVARRIGFERIFPLRVARLVGYIWVFLWYVGSMPPSINWHVKLGLLEEPYTFSVARVVLAFVGKRGGVDGLFRAL